MEDLKFSVSMCVYAGDNSEWFDQALQSVFNQSLIPNEVVLFVDGPVPDCTEEIIQKYTEKSTSFKVIRSKENVGHGNARRICMQNCSNELIALMDADDICVYDRFEKQINAFKKNQKLSIVGGQITEFIDTPTNIIGKRTVPLKDRDIKEYLKRRCPMNQVTVMFKKSDVSSVGGYIDWYCEEDYFLWIRMTEKNLEFENIDDILVNVRVGKEMYQRRGGWKYFLSEVKLQKYMLKNNITGVLRFVINVTERLILQVLMPNRVRGFIFKIFARD